MNPFTNDVNEYEEEALRTAKDMGSVKMNLIHAALGLSSDVGEFVDCIKKHAIYGKDLDKKNAIEELGDVLWFVVLACNTLNVNLSDVMRANIEKLAKRYSDKYSDEAAIARADKKKEVNVQEAINELVDIDNRYPHQTEMDSCTSNMVAISPNVIDAANYRYSELLFDVNPSSWMIHSEKNIITTIPKGSISWNSWYYHATKVPA